jgi:hypothetical protein
MVKKGETVRKKSASAKTAVKKTASSTRVRKGTKKQLKKKVKKQVRSDAPIIGSFKLTWQSLKFIKRHWRPLGGVVLIYTLLNLVFASSLMSNAGSVVSSFNNGNFRDALNSFSTIVSGGSSGQAATLQSILIILESLVIIWALRHLFSGEKINVKHAYYHSTTQLVPFLIVVFFVVLQLLPITIGSTVLSLVLSSLLGNAVIEAAFVALFILLTFWSLYMVCSSVFALYIVTLPDMHPRSATRSARNLVHFRRWHVVRRLLFLPLFIIFFMGISIVPMILYAKFFVAPTFFILSMLTVLYVHTYLYSLYKDLLK